MSTTGTTDMMTTPLSISTPVEENTVHSYTSHDLSIAAKRYTLAAHVYARLQAHDLSDLTVWTTNGFLTYKKLIDSTNVIILDNLAWHANLPTIRREKPTSYRFECILKKLSASLKVMERDIFALSFCCPVYDVSPDAPGNGYRSLVNTGTSCLEKVHSYVQEHQDTRDSFFLGEATSVYRGLSDYSDIVESLCYLFNNALVMVAHSNIDSLFPEEPGDTMRSAENLDKELFYSKRFGFQYPESIRGMLKLLIVTMASHSDAFHKTNVAVFQRAIAFAASVGYMTDAESRGQRLAEEYKREDVKFLRSFWDLSETTAARHAAKFVSPSMSVIGVNKVLSIPVHSSINLPMRMGETTLIQWKDIVRRGLEDEEERCPYAFNFEVVLARLISYRWKEGQAFHNNHIATGDVGSPPPADTLFSKPFPRAKGLIVHFHGGGFIGQSSRSHQLYLKEWAKQLDVPILSVDYSLAPQYRFPRAFNECFYVYCWALENAEKLGTTADHICLAGDSAGANLVLAVTLKAIREGLRCPNALIAAYPVTKITYSPGPSRMLSVMDPVLPMGVLKACLTAYRLDRDYSDNMEVNAYDEDSTDDMLETREGLSAAIPIPSSSKRNAAISPTPESADQEFQFPPKTDSFTMLEPIPPLSDSVYLSPLLAQEEDLALFPPTFIAGCELDPLLDDSVMFARRLKAAGNNLRFTVYPGLPHGFLSFSKVNKAVDNPCNDCLQFLRANLTGCAEQGNATPKLDEVPWDESAMDNIKL